MIHCMQYGDGQVLAYAEYGAPSGFPVLVQHGMIASIRGGQIFTRLVEAGARLICVARPGYGESSPRVMRTMGDWGQIVARLVEHLGLGQVDVLGTSSGAPYSYAIGYALPAQVRRIFILSGTPALYDPLIQANWPYPIQPDTRLVDLQPLAYQLFFASLSEAERQSVDVHDSMRNDCFGIAQDLYLRVRDWGFDLSAVRQPVYLRHSRADEAVPLVTAEQTAQLLPHSQLEIREDDPHFSQAVLDDFIETAMVGWYRPVGLC